MDLSHHFLTMCTKAHELQAQWTPQNADLCHIRSFKSYSIIWLAYRNNTCVCQIGDRVLSVPDDFAFYGVVWIPRRSQLLKLCDFCMIPLPVTSIQQSDEQRLLCQYMYTFFKKVWIDETWVMISSSLPVRKERENYGI